MPPLISVITLTHNKLEVTRKCLASLLATAYRPWELVVVDNGSTDGTRAWLAEFAETATAAGIQVTVLLNPGNIGCSTARNQGVAAAGGERLVFVDNDVAVRNRNWLDGLAEQIDSDPQVAIVGPKLVYPFAPYRIQCAGVGISQTGRVLFRGRGESRHDPRFNEPREVQCVISACCMLRRHAFEDAGGFDEAFNPVQYEDFDLCYRIREKGLRAWYLPTVEMYHFESVTTAGTATIANSRIIIRHGLLFKRRWHHMFEKEDGPADPETAWRAVETRPFAEIDDLPVVE